MKIRLGIEAVAVVISLLVIFAFLIFGWRGIENLGDGSSLIKALFTYAGFNIFLIMFVCVLSGWAYNTFTKKPDK